MSSLRYEQQKKKQAVRRLSSGSRQGPHGAPEGRIPSSAARDLRSRVLQRNALSRAGSEPHRTQHDSKGILGLSDVMQMQAAGCSPVPAAALAQEAALGLHKQGASELNPFLAAVGGSNKLFSQSSSGVQASTRSSNANPFGTSVTAVQSGDTENKMATVSLKSDAAAIPNPFATALSNTSSFARASFGGLVASSTAKQVGGDMAAVAPVSFTIKPVSSITGQLSAGERRSKRFQTSSQGDKVDDSGEGLVSLRLKGIPDGLLDKEALRLFYSKFGDIKRVYTHLPTASAIITFEKHEDAANAKINGRVLRDGWPPIAIFWKADKQTPSTKTVEKPPAVPPPAFSHQMRDRKQSSHSSLVQLIESHVASVGSVQARTAGEKFGVLDKIDQKLREGLKRETDISKAKILVGTCPDICPEKERYLREDRRRLATFEVVAGTENANTLEGEFSSVDHNKAVKEYSRSSADQEEPLPHELRPVSTLTESMNYLIFNVLDAGATNWTEWYDFVWNRTRAIRKDITQQNLKDKHGILLMEQCARFHIVCAHLLCEENVNVFDAKINNENLTKCLQSLKQMYYDLMQDKGETCENESEFRAYQILLNLNDGNILSEAMSFREEVRTSPEVKFAIALFSALNSTNYIRFLKLLRQAPYLVACLAHRYANQIRASGLRIMNRAYKGTSTNMPAKDICRVLAFDTEELAMEFCQHYSLLCQDGMVCFSKAPFKESEQSFRTIKSGIITRKRITSIGQVVCGQAMIAQFSLKPQSVSFDANGMYNGTYHQLALAHYRHQATVPMHQGSLGPPPPYFSSVPTAPLSIRPPQQMPIPFQMSQSTLQAVPPAAVMDEQANRQELINIMREQTKDICKQYLLEAIDYMLKTVAAGVMTTVYNLQAESSCVLKDVMAGVVASEVAEMCRRIHLVERRRSLEMRKAVVNSASETLKLSLCDSVATLMIREISMGVCRAEQAKESTRRQERATSQLSADIMEEFVTMQVASTSSEVVTAMRNARKKRLMDSYNAVLIKRQRKAFQRWFFLHQWHLRIKTSLSQFPPMPLASSVDDAVADMTGCGVDCSTSYDALNQSISFSGGVSLNVDSADSLSRKRKRHKHAIEEYHQRARMEREAWLTPISLSEIVLRIGGASESRGQILWKVAVSLTPSLDESTTAHIRRKLGLPDTLQTATLDKGVACGHVLLGNATVVKSCVEEFAFNRSNTWTSFGSSGLVFVFDPSLGSWEKERDRLERFLLAKPCSPRVPVAILASSLSHSPSVEEIQACLCLDKHPLIDAASSFSCHVLNATDCNLLHQKLVETLQWLFRHQPLPPGLELDTLLSYIEKGLALFYDNAVNDMNTTQDAIHAHLEPSMLIDLYNHVIAHLLHVITHDDLQTISWPPPQLTMLSDTNAKNFLPWNSTDQFRVISLAMEQLFLPPFPSLCTDDTWDNQLEHCMRYLQCVNVSLHADDDVAWSMLLNRVLGVLNKAIRSVRSVPRYANQYFPWPAIIKQCICHSMDYFSSSDILQSSVATSRGVIYYRQSDLNAFDPPSSFLELSISSRHAVFDQRCQPSRSSLIDAAILDVDTQLTDILRRNKSPDDDSTKSGEQKLKRMEQDVYVLKERTYSERLHRPRRLNESELSFDIKTDTKRRKLAALSRSKADFLASPTSTFHAKEQ